MSTSSLWSIAFVVANGLAIVLGSALSLFAGIYLYSLVRFKLDFRRFANAKEGHNLQAPHLPFAIPWVGNAPSFLTKKVHKFWTQLFSWYPRSVGAVSITLGGQQTAVIFNAPAAQYIMKDRKLGRQAQTEQVVMQGFGLSREDTDSFNGSYMQPKDGELSAHDEQDKMHQDYLLKTGHVNELTAEFMECFKQRLRDEFREGPAELSLFSWLRTLMFRASTHALMGSRILDVCPELEPQFFQFDQDMLSLFFGLPKFMVSKQFNNRRLALDSLVKWHETIEKEGNGKIVDPDSIAWEPLYGSRINRARQIFYRKQGLGYQGASSLDFGMLFGLQSNAIPAAGWMLMHILDSKRPENIIDGEPTLYDHVMNELRESQNPDGSPNIPVLVNRPILSSTLHEVLRLYVDTLLSREVPYDMTLPLSHPSPTTKEPSRSLFLKAGSLLMMPTWPAHTNPETWCSPEYPHHPPANVFYPYRFLTSSPSDPKEKPVFTTAHTMGMFFPFGGGKTICPGRIFAKQEMLGSVAVALLNFDFDVLGYVDAKGKNTSKFPGLRDTFPGSAVMVASGDLRVTARRR